MWARVALPGSESVNVQTMRKEDGSLEIVGRPDHNDHRVTAAHLSALQAMASGPVEEQSFNVSFPWNGFTSANVEAGWLRSAYLAAFARLGYRYAFRRLFAPVRAQIADPQGEHITRFYLGGAESPPTRRAVILIERPRSLRSVAVIMGRHCILLPGVHADSDTFYDRLAARATWPPRGRSGRFDGKALGWPTRPLLSMDFGPEARGTASVIPGARPADH